MGNFTKFVIFLVISALFHAAAPGSAAAAPPDDGKLRIIVFGAHPDDSEIKAGGCGAMWAAMGHHVKFVATTNGDIGHWKQAGGALARRRRGEVEAAANILGIEETQVLDNHDGELMPTLENRKVITRLIREWNADIVISHRSYDYHPDHRYTGILVQDAAFMVTVPFFCPDVPALEKNPVFLYSYDRFMKPYPLEPDIVVSIDSVIETKLNALAVMESQFLEGGVYGDESRLYTNQADYDKGQQAVKDRFRRRFEGIADRYRDKLIEIYGPNEGKSVQTAEAFEVCEYGGQPTPEELKALFPFVK